MKVCLDCTQAMELASFYVGGQLDGEDTAAVMSHLVSCPECRVAFSKIRSGHAPLAETRSQPALSIPVPQAQPGFSQRLGAAPWWLVSVSLHILLIALASLISMAIELPNNDDAVIMLTELQSRPLTEKQHEPEKSADTSILSKRETPPTDPTSPEASNITLPPDILARAELSDHFETINPELPDTHSALGNPDSQSFHSVSGNTEAAGGGGTGGLGMDDVIGIGGATTNGSGGGFGGGDGIGVGVGSGAGKGSFGQRSGGGRKLLVKRNGGSKATESAVDQALLWLAYHQEADGHWNVVKYGGGKSAGFGCAADAAGDVGMTGLATLAFLGAGHTQKIGSYRDNVKRALDFLVSHQRADGTFSDVRTQDYDRYDATLATLALSEAFAMSRDQKLGDCAQLGVDYLIKLQQPYGGWIHYTWNSTSFFGWVVMALKSAKIAGLKIPKETFEGALKFMEKAAERDADGYWGKVRYDPFNAFEINQGLTMTAVGMTALEFIGHGSETMHQAEMIAQFPPEWDPGRSFEREPQNFYHWYYGTLGLFQHGGELWKKWNEALKSTLLPNQRKDGDEAGSWDPVTAFDIQGGRVYTTAMGALTLEIYYRYMRLADK